MVSDPTHLCRIGVGLVSDVSVGVGSDTFVSDWRRISVGCVGWCLIRHICVGMVSDLCRMCRSVSASVVFLSWLGVVSDKNVFFY